MGGRDWFPSPFLIMDMEMPGKSGRVFLKKSFFFPSLGAILLFSKVFAFIKSLFAVFLGTCIPRKNTRFIGLGVFSDSSSL